MVHDDIHNLWVCGVRVDRQEILDDHQTHVDIQSFKVVDHLRVFDGHQFVDELNISSESEHVGVVFAGHQLFDDVDDDPKALLALRRERTSSVNPLHKK